MGCRQAPIALIENMRIREIYGIRNTSISTTLCLCFSLPCPRFAPRTFSQYRLTRWPTSHSARSITWASSMTVCQNGGTEFGYRHRNDTLFTTSTKTAEMFLEYRLRVAYSRDVDWLPVRCSPSYWLRVPRSIPLLLFCTSGAYFSIKSVTSALPSIVQLVYQIF